MDSSVLKDIGTCKTKILSLLMASPDICELFLGKNYTEDDVDNLMYKQVFPYLYIDNTQTEVLSYLCVEVNVPRVPTGTIKRMEVTIFCYSHKRCMEYSKKGFLGTRVDILADMVERCLRDSKELGIGRIQLSSVNTYFPSNDYYGRQMSFLCPDFKVKE